MLGDATAIDEVEETLGTVSTIDEIEETLGNVRSVDDVEEILGSVTAIEEVEETLGSVTITDGEETVALGETMDVVETVVLVVSELTRLVEEEPIDELRLITLAVELENDV